METIFKRKIASGYSKEIIKECAELLKVEHDYNDYCGSMLMTFVSILKTVDTKYWGIEVLNDLVLKYHDELSKLKKYDNREYSLKIYNNFFVECIVCILLPMETQTFSFSMVLCSIIFSFSLRTLKSLRLLIVTSMRKLFPLSYILI